MLAAGSNRRAPAPQKEFESMKTPLVLGSVALVVLLTGSIYLLVAAPHGGPQSVTSQLTPVTSHTYESRLTGSDATPSATTTPAIGTPTTDPTLISINTPTATATVTHSIDWVSISPPSITAGASSPVTVTAQITDPAVIRNSVNLVYMPPSGAPTVIATLNDAGVNGDLTADDNIFSLTTTTLFSTYRVGTVQLAVSAAFTGTLSRAQSTFQFGIDAPVSTAGWVPLTDSQRLFSIQVPSAWNLHTTENPTDGEDIKSVDFAFPDGTVVFSIFIYTPDAWALIQTGGEPAPALVGQTHQYIFGEADSQAEILNESVSETDIFKALPQILATFRAF